MRLLNTSPEFTRPCQLFTCPSGVLNTFDSYKWKNLITWHCHRLTELCLRSWPEGGVLYDDASGTLHTLTSVGSEVMGIFLKGKAWSALSLFIELLGDSPIDEDLEMMEKMLDHLQSLHLISKNTA